MIKLAIDFGTAVTKIYRLGSGIVLAEATCLTVQKDTGEIRAYGNEAKRLLGKTSEFTEVVFPVYEGDIVNERYAGALLEYFLSKVTSRSAVEALFCVPCACTVASRERYYRVAKAAGISRVSFVEVPYLAALGQDVPLSEANPVFVLDIGAGKASAAVFSLDGIIAGLTMNVGGSNIDRHIIDHVAEKFDLRIGALTSEKLKNTVGSFIENDNHSCVVNGRDVKTGKPNTVIVSSGDILFPVQVYIDKILEYAELVLKRLPAEVSAEMCKNGVYLSGGVCALAGFADYVEKKLQTEAHLASDPVTCAVLGGGRVIGNASLLHKIEMV